MNSFAWSRARSSARTLALVVLQVALVTAVACDDDDGQPRPRDAGRDATVDTAPITPSDSRPPDSVVPDGGSRDSSAGDTAVDRPADTTVTPEVTPPVDTSPADVTPQVDVTAPVDLAPETAVPTETTFLATLTGSEEVPPVATTATGTATLVLNAAKNKLSYTLKHNVVGPMSAHLHTAWVGENGPITLPLNVGATDTTGTLDVTPGFVADLEAGKVYVNVHSATRPSGEIRGQVLAPGETIFVANLSGWEEVPVVTTTATGRASVILNAAKTAIRYNLRHSVAAASAAHFHGPALGGENAGVAFAIAPLAAESSGTATVTSAQVIDLEAGKLYVNVHSPTFLSGEIRGQVLRPGELLFVGQLSGLQETPSVTTTATGSVSAILNAAKTSLRYKVTSTGLSATAAHFHRGLAKFAGPVAYPLAGLTAVIEGTQVVNASDADEIESGLWYVNLHTAGFPGGELRGQLLTAGEKIFAAILTGAQEVPPVTTTNSGNGMVILAPGRDSIRYHLTTNVTATMAHIHKAPGGVAGAVEITIPAGASAKGTSAITAGQLADLERGLWYFNVHSATAPGGEVRGQVLGIGETLYTAVLTGAEEVPAVTTTAAAGIGLILNAAGTQLRYDGTIAGLTATAAHIHAGAVGANGGVVYPLAYTGTTFAGMQDVMPADLTALNGAGWYANVHTATNPGGEIRGQIIKK